MKDIYIKYFTLPKTRNEGTVNAKAVYLAIGVNMDGLKEVLGMWIARTEGAKFWPGILTELKNRGLQDIFIASVDGLKGFPEAIESVYPETQIQLCIVHMVRNSLKFVSWKQRAEMASDLKAIYGSATEEEGKRQLEFFAEKWDDTHPTVVNHGSLIGIDCRPSLTIPRTSGE